VNLDFDKTLLRDEWSYGTWGNQKHSCTDRPASHGCGWHPEGSSPSAPPGCAPGPPPAHPPAPPPSRPPAVPPRLAAALQPCPSARPPGTGGAGAHPEPPVQLTPVSACPHSQQTLWTMCVTMSARLMACTNVVGTVWKKSFLITHSSQFNQMSCQP